MTFTLTVGDTIATISIEELVKRFTSPVVTISPDDTTPTYCSCGCYNEYPLHALMPVYTHFRDHPVDYIHPEHYRVIYGS